MEVVDLQGHHICVQVMCKCPFISQDLWMHLQSNPSAKGVKLKLAQGPHSVCFALPGASLHN